MANTSRVVKSSFVCLRINLFSIAFFAACVQTVRLSSRMPNLRRVLQSVMQSVNSVRKYRTHVSSTQQTRLNKENNLLN